MLGSSWNQAGPGSCTRWWQLQRAGNAATVSSLLKPVPGSPEPAVIWRHRAGRRENTGKTDLGENRHIGICEILSASPFSPQSDILSFRQGGRRAGLAQTPLLPLNSSFRHNLVLFCDGFWPHSSLHRKKRVAPKHEAGLLVGC